MIGTPAPRTASAVEIARLTLQATLDCERSQKQRKEMGQLATPPPLAEGNITFVSSIVDARPVRFLEPSSGSW